jgi:hypothetical protein
MASRRPGALKPAEAWAERGLRGLVQGRDRVPHERHFGRTHARAARIPRHDRLSPAPGSLTGATNFPRRIHSLL